MDKHVLLTAMSTFPNTYAPPNNLSRVAVPNYYKALIDGQNLYCNGILQTEAGTKFFLHDCDYLDKIVAIVSSETIYDSKALSSVEPDIQYIEDIGEFVDEARRRINAYDSNKPGSPLSPYGYYAYRIGEFLRQIDEESDKLRDYSINEERRHKLEEIAQDVLLNAGITDPALWFYSVDNEMAQKSKAGKKRETIFYAIEQKLIKDIENEYIPESEYTKYIGTEGASNAELEVEKSLSNLKNQLSVSVEDLNKLKKSIEELQETVIKTYSFKAFAKEVWLKVLQKIVEHNISDLQKEIIVQKADAYTQKEVVYGQLIETLTDVIGRLSKELHDIKTNRKITELNYIKSDLYRRLEGQYRLKPKNPLQHVSLEYVKDEIALDNMPETGSIPNLTGIVNAICPNGTTDDIHLYIDMQGSYRTNAYVRNAVLAILNNASSNNVHIEKIVSTQFDRTFFTSTIVDDTRRYKIIDLASGMNAFIQYGRADQIRAYFNSVYDSKVPTQIKDLLIEMETVDHALSLCDIDALETSIKNIHEIFSRDYTISDEFSGIFNTMAEIIRQDYRGLLVPDKNDPSVMKIDYIALTEWAYRKHFIQQAITIIESKMPRVLVDMGILYYCSADSNIRNKVLRLLSEELKAYKPKKDSSDSKIKPIKFPWQLMDISHFVLRTYRSSNNAVRKKTAEIKSFTKKYPGKYDNNAWPKTCFLIAMLTEEKRKIISLFSDINLTEPANLFSITKLLYLYSYIANVRNEINHSSESNRICYSDSITLIKDFLDIFKEVTAILPNEPAIATHITPIELYEYAVKNENLTWLKQPDSRNST